MRPNLPRLAFIDNIRWTMIILTRFLSRNAFAVYVFHPPFVILGASELVFRRIYSL